MQLADEPKEKLIEAIDRLTHERDAALLKLHTAESRLAAVRKWKGQWSHDLPNSSAVFDLNEALFGALPEPPK